MAHKRKQLSGGAKMKLAGRHPIMCGSTEQEWKLLRAYAEEVHRPVAWILVQAGLLEACEYLGWDHPIVKAAHARRRQNNGLTPVIRKRKGGDA